MAKSIKLKNNTYWDTISVVHGRQTLKDFLNNRLYVYSVSLTRNGTYDWNTIADAISGRGIIISDVNEGNTRTGAPTGAYNWGTLITFKPNATSRHYSNTQIYIPDSTSRIYYRSLNSNVKYWNSIPVSTDNRVAQYGVS